MAPLKTVFATLALVLAATALPAAAPSQEDANLVKRDPFEIAVYADGACSSKVVAENNNLEPSGCWNFNTGSGAYGAFLLNIYENRQGCYFKMWELPNCHGKATVQYESNSCVAIANKDGQFYVTDGIQSAQIICS